jgi:hypothetical protein
MNAPCDDEWRGDGGRGVFSLSKVHIMTYLEFLFVADKAFRGQNLKNFLNLEKAQRF